MPQFAANLSLMYTELPFLDRFAAAARDRFTAVEFQFPYAFAPAEVAARLADQGLQLVLFNAPAGGARRSDMATAWEQGARGTAALPGREAEFRAGVQEALRYAEQLGCPRIHVLSGIVPPGVERESLKDLCANNQRWAAAEAARVGREIRIEPINLIMQDLPFYDDDHRLQIATRENQSVVRTRFRKELRDVRALIEAASSDDEREAAYTRMSKLIDRIRRTAPDFSDLIDVRNHVRVSAERIDAVTKRHVALYDHIGEKSGGESQELIAFIVGAALRYQLGDAGSERPRYAPVFLDEACRPFAVRSDTGTDRLNHPLLNVMEARGVLAPLGAMP